MTLIKSLGMAAVAGLMALPASSVLAQTEALTLSTMTVTRHDIIRTNDTDMASPCCAQHTYESGADTDFIYIDADFAVAWSDELDRIQISSSDITLEIPGETDARAAWGRVDYFPHVMRSGTSLNARRPRDFPDETAGAYLNLVFTVPTAATTATLVIGDPEDGAVMRLPVDLTAQPTELPTAASLYDIKVVEITTMPELVTENRIGRNTVDGRMVPRTGVITRIEVEVTPIVGTDTDNEPDDPLSVVRGAGFALVGPEGLPLTYLGTSFSGSIRANHSTSLSWDLGEEPPSRTMTLFYHGSGAAGDYHLFFYDQQVADVPLRE
ncbi:hypothetical protein [Gymnodinialimonas sp.]